MDLSTVVRLNGAIAVLLGAELLSLASRLRGAALIASAVGVAFGALALATGRPEFLLGSALGVYGVSVACGGTYCGGADSMQLYTLMGVGLSGVLPSPFSRWALALVFAHLVLSYAIAAWVKITNPQWRSGEAMTRLPSLTEYSVPEKHARWIRRYPRLLAWVTISLEVVLAGGWLVATHGAGLPWVAALITAGGAFHLLNFLVLGLNRFFWTWMGAYSAAAWFVMIR